MKLPVRLEFCGAALATACGLALGGAMHPSLDALDRPAGPQMIAGDAAMRAAGLSDTAAMLASYRGSIPDYVVGTDVRKAASWRPERIATAAPEPRMEPESRMEAEETPADEPPVIGRAAYEERPLARSRDYPSLGAADRDDDEDDGPSDPT